MLSRSILSCGSGSVFFLEAMTAAITFSAFPPICVKVHLEYIHHSLTLCTADVTWTYQAMWRGIIENNPVRPYI